MTMLFMQHLTLYAVLVLLCWAMVSDGRTLTIPNRIPVAIVGLYPAWTIAAWPAAEPLGGVIAAAAVLAGGLVVFSRGWCGGGDAKLLAALALWAGPALLLDMLIVTALAGGVLALAVLLTAALRRRNAVAASGGEGGTAAPGGSVLARPIPYGIAIAFGGAYVAMRLLAA